MYDLVDWRNNSEIDVYWGDETFYKFSDYGFSDDQFQRIEDTYEEMVKFCYWSFTTLSSVGYGDYSPKSVSEKLAMCFVLLIGITIFSILCNNMMDILMDYRNLGE